MVVFFSIKHVTRSGNGGHMLCQTSSTMKSGIPEKAKFLSCSDFGGLCVSYCDFWKGFLVVQAITNCLTFSNTKGEILSQSRENRFLKEIVLSTKRRKIICYKVKIRNKAGFFSSTFISLLWSQIKSGPKIFIFYFLLSSCFCQEIEKSNILRKGLQKVVFADWVQF